MRRKTPALDRPHPIVYLKQMRTVEQDRHRTIIFALFLLSGCAGLIYEVVWTRKLTFVFGGTTYAITTILVAFMSGLGLGSYVAGRLSHRLRQPGRTYGILEVMIGAYALLVPLLFGMAEPAYRSLYPRLSDAPWLLTGVRFCMGFGVLVIPTTFMGATLPILVRHVTGLGQGFGRSVGLLYGINTLGAMIGTVAAGFWLLPAFGLAYTTWIAAAINGLVGVTAIVALRLPAVGPMAPQGQTRAPAAAASPEAAVPPPALRWAVLIGFAVSGFAAMVYQIAWTRTLIMSIGSSTYSFTCILAAFILGLALGSLAVARWVDRVRNPALVFGAMEIAIGLSAVLIAPVYGRIPSLIRGIVSEYRENYTMLLSIEFALIIAMTFVPTFLMGAVFPLVTRMLAVGHGDPGAATGQAYAVNTLGTIAGSFLAGFVMIRSDVLGVQNSIVAAALLNALAGAALILLSGPGGRITGCRVAVPTVLVLLVPVFARVAGEWDRSSLLSAPFLGRNAGTPSDEREECLYYAEGTDLTVAVTRAPRAPDSISLTVNGKPDASTDIEDVLTQLMLGHLPALLVNEGRTACVIGLGSGMTLSAVARYSTYEQLDCAEISSEVIEAARHFGPFNCDVLTNDPRVRILRADGRNHLLLTNRTYDLIVSEPSNPWMAGVANLFTREYFRLCRDRLSADGRVCIWLHSYSMSLPDFRMVVRTLFDVFPEVSVWQLSTDFLLIAGRRQAPVSLDGILARFNQPAVREDLCRAGLFDVGQVLGTFVSSGEPLRAWAAPAPVHTDDNALLEFSAPRSLYRHDESAITAAMLAHQRSPFDELIAIRPDDPRHQAVRDRIAAAFRSRNDLAGSWALERKGDYVGSLRLLVSACVHDRENTQAYNTVMQCRPTLEQRNPTLARSPQVQALLNKADSLCPPTPPSGRRCGTQTADIVRSLRATATDASQYGRWDCALALLEVAAGLEPDNPDVNADAAHCLVKLRRADEAAQRLDAVLRIHPEHGSSHYVLAMLAAASDNPDAAYPSLEAAIRLRAATPEQAANEEAFRSLRDQPRFQAILQQFAQTRPTTAPH